MTEIASRRALGGALCGLILCAQTHAADVLVTPPAGNPDPGSTFDVEIVVESGADVVGAYAIDVSFDPSVIVVDAVLGGASAAFSSSPVSNATTFTTGLTPVVGAQASAFTPSGSVSVATLRFRATGLAGAVSPIGITVLELTDGDTLPLPTQTLATSVQLSFVAADDTDGDGLSDLDEANAGTDINNPDTDGDGLTDGFEVSGGLDPLDNGSVDTQQGASGDPDGDGLDNLTEQTLGTNPTLADSDGDGLDDGAEVAGGTNPTLVDSDGDGLGDGFEVGNGLDANDNGSVNIDNGALGDPDSDGLGNLDELMAGTDPMNPDSDADGLPDGYEVSHGLDPLDDGSVDSNQGASGDPDLDGFINLDEFAQLSDPRNDHSQPVDLTVDLVTGSALIAYPLNPAPAFSTFDLLAILNAQGDVVSEMSSIGPGNVISRSTWIGGAPGGVDAALATGQGVYATIDSAVALPFSGAVDCPGIDLSQGSNVVGLRCIAPDDSAFDLLMRLGAAAVTSIQRLDPVTGLYESAYFLNGLPTGVDFPLRRGEAYLIHAIASVGNFDPLQ